MPRSAGIAVGRATVAVVLTVFSMLGCAPMSTFQSPDTLELGERAVGVGVLQVPLGPEYLEDRALFPSVWYRRALADDTDLGVKVGLREGVLLDVKRVFFRRPLALAGDLGVAVGVVDPSFGVSRWFLVIRPAVLLGSKNIYGGVWTNLQLSEFQWERMHGLMVGTALGTKRKLMLECNWFKQEGAGNASVSFGLGFQGQLGR